ncbi:MAG: hypothetical protein B7Z26_05360, partial [Asticcacaulis sp. 32-58-5]
MIGDTPKGDAASSASSIPETASGTEKPHTSLSKHGDPAKKGAAADSECSDPAPASDHGAGGQHNGSGHGAAKGAGFLALAVGSVGVVFGDI